MASSRQYLSHVLDMLSLLDGVRERPMMGEYVLYYKDKVIGGIYDDRLLLKPVSSLPDGPYEIPYDGAKPMFSAAHIEDKEFLRDMIEKMYPLLPETKKTGKA